MRIVERLSSRFSISLIIACAAHVGLLFGMVLSSSETQTGPRVLSVTLSTAPGAIKSKSEVIATADQTGQDNRSQRSETASTGEQTQGFENAGATADASQARPVSAPVLARRGGNQSNENARETSSSNRQSGPQRNAENAKVKTARSDLRAAYLESWRQVVEKAGNRQLETARLEHGTAGQRLTLEVTLAAAGTINKIRVRRTSGNAALDDAAQALLHDAAPFSSFPPALAAQYPTLTFAYDWRFLPGGGGGE